MRTLSDGAGVVLFLESKLYHVDIEASMFSIPDFRWSQYLAADRGFYSASAGIWTKYER